MELFQRLVNSPSKKQQRQKQQQFSRWTRCTSSCLCFTRRHSRTSITDTVELPNTWPQCQQPSFVSLLLTLLLPLLLLLSAIRSYSVNPEHLNQQHYQQQQLKQCHAHFHLQNNNNNKYNNDNRNYIKKLLQRRSPLRCFCQALLPSGFQSLSFYNPPLCSCQVP